MSDLEEGEVSDSSEDEKGGMSRLGVIHHQPTLSRSVSYRSTLANIDSSDEISEPSDNETDSEEDAMLLKKKRQRFRAPARPAPEEEPFVNPISQGTHSLNSFDDTKPRKVNNVWGRVLQEQSIVAEIDKFDVKEYWKEKKAKQDRDVESYDYTRVVDDDEEESAGSSSSPVHKTIPDPRKVDYSDLGPQAPSEVLVLNERKRKRNEKWSRLPSRTADSPIPGGEADALTDVAGYIAHRLLEPKTDLIERAVTNLGNEKALSLLREVEEIEAKGGMPVMNGSRRRTPGGVFLTIIKQDPEIDQEARKIIFEEDQKQVKNKKKKARRRNVDKKLIELKEKLQSRSQVFQSDGKMDAAEEGAARGENGAENGDHDPDELQLTDEIVLDFE